LFCLKSKVRRIGGAYGGKATSSQLIAAATALAANKVNRPVRLVLDLKTNMEMFGKKFPYLGKYKVIDSHSYWFNYFEIIFFL